MQNFQKATIFAAREIREKDGEEENLMIEFFADMRDYARACNNQAKLAHKVCSTAWYSEPVEIEIIYTGAPNKVGLTHAVINFEFWMAPSAAHVLETI